MSIKLFFFLVIIGSATRFYSCQDAATKTSPKDIIKKYERLVLEMKADSLLQMFTVDAEIGHEGGPTVKGRDSIYAFLSSFKNIRVISNRDDVLSVSINKDSAIVNGDYKQAVIVLGKDTVNAAGKFTANMIRKKNKNWLIFSMRTRSL